MSSNINIGIRHPRLLFLFCFCLRAVSRLPVEVGSANLGRVLVGSARVDAHRWRASYPDYLSFTNGLDGQNQVGLLS